MPSSILKKSMSSSTIVVYHKGLEENLMVGVGFVKCSKSIIAIIVR